jgi:hypothetical protein
LSALMQALESYPTEEELVLNISRCLSKLSSDTRCLNALEAAPNALLVLLRMAELHHSRAPVLLRIAFVLGNATSHSAQARTVLGDDLHARDTLVRLLVLQFDAVAAAAAATGCLVDAGGHLQSMGGTNASTTSAEAEEACVKLLRLLANLAMHDPAGRALAASVDLAGVLVQLLGSCSFERSGELVLNAVAALSNLAFYWKPLPAPPSNKVGAAWVFCVRVCV